MAESRLLATIPFEREKAIQILLLVVGERA